MRKDLVTCLQAFSACLINFRFHVYNIIKYDFFLYAYCNKCSYVIFYPQFNRLWKHSVLFLIAL